jgi:hypothetical protein
MTEMIGIFVHYCYCEYFQLAWCTRFVLEAAMVAYARRGIVDEEQVGVYHYVARCVRRACLCGTDSYSDEIMGFAVVTVAGYFGEAGYVLCRHYQCPDRGETHHPSRRGHRSTGRRSSSRTAPRVMSGVHPPFVSGWPGPRRAVLTTIRDAPAGRHRRIVDHAERFALRSESHFRGMVICPPVKIRGARHGGSSAKAVVTVHPAELYQALCRLRIWRSEFRKELRVA